MNNMKWTLIKDSLPPEPIKMYDTCKYLVTVHNNQVVAVEYCKTTIRNKEALRFEWRGRVCPWEVLAWIPFPSACDIDNYNKELR